MVVLVNKLWFFIYLNFFCSSLYIPYDISDPFHPIISLLCATRSTKLDNNVLKKKVHKNRLIVAVYNIDKYLLLSFVMMN